MADQDSHNTHSGLNVESVVVLREEMSPFLNDIHYSLQAQ